ncbi:stellacyanin-like [Rutidosis leptorrhynchoides]|uniref:stellacyanin-like n=1 Tax=Rutidosis leptorrhynchoides TaxID=125765 RepID=UPI003A98FE63
MVKLLFVCLLIGFISCAAATTYMVGDSAGWDISSDLNTWVADKTFQVGDVLVFQYSSSDSLSEVTKENFDTCNTSNVITSYSSNGNTTVPLTKPGERYFISGNRMYCLGGMKLKVNVEGDNANPPNAAPQSQPGAAGMTQPSSKTNTPSTVFPTSKAVLHRASLQDASLLLLGIFFATFLQI